MVALERKKQKDRINGKEEKARDNSSVRGIVRMGCRGNVAKVGGPWLTAITRRQAPRSIDRITWSRLCFAATHLLELDMDICVVHTVILETSPEPGSPSLNQW
jgi:hypothetical protein